MSDSNITRSGTRMVRVRDKATGHAYSIAAVAVDPELHSVLKGASAVGSDGRPLAPAYNKALKKASKPAAAKAAPAADSPAPTAIPDTKAGTNKTEEK